jgi:flagellar basal-body rod protein FlgG
MLEGLYSAAAGMEAQQQQLDVISNDLANMDTPGYQSERIGFEDLLYNSAGADEGSGVTVGTGSAAVDLGPSQDTAPISSTGQPLDVAINGNAYFEVKQADGSLALTRNGSFQLDGSGRLTTATGQLVQPPITVPSGYTAADVVIGSDGTVSVAGQKLGQLALVNVTAPGQLTAVGDSLFVANSASGPTSAVSSATVEQGSLNGSDVDLATEMVQMMNVEQSYSMTSKAIDIQNQMMQIANQVRQ